MDTDAIRFQTYNSAATMSGKYNGTQKRISEKLKRPITYIPCLPHGSILVIEHDCIASNLVKNMYDTLESSYLFFTSSTSRYAAFRDKLAPTEGVLKLRSLSKTKWSARPESVEAFWKSYEEIGEVLREITEAKSKYDAEPRTKSNGLLCKIQSFEFIVSLMFMKTIMYKTKQMVDVLQTEELDSDALSIMKLTLDSLQVIRNYDNDQMSLVEAAINFGKTLDVDGEEEFRRVHHQRKLQKKLDNDPKTTAEFPVCSYYCKEINAVLDTIIFVLASKCKHLKYSISPQIFLMLPKDIMNQKPLLKPLISLQTHIFQK